MMKGKHSGSGAGMGWKADFEVSLKGDVEKFNS